MNTDSCAMRRVADGDQVVNGAPGDFAIYELPIGGTWISMRLPGNGFCTLPLNQPKGWQWDGNLDSPTLSPSVFHDPNSGSSIEWHGFVRNGRMESC